MRKEKGFTLIELLAVIVILAVIALIVTPIVLNVINKSRRGAAIDSAYGYIKAIEYQNQMNELDSTKYSKVTSGNVSGINVKVKGSKPDSGNVTIEKNQVTSAELCINGYKIIYQNSIASVASDSSECRGGNQESGDNTNPNTNSLNVWLKDISGGKKELCIKYNNQDECFKHDDFDNEKEHLKKVFGEEKCHSEPMGPNRSYYSCEDENYRCSVFPSNAVDCIIESDPDLPQCSLGEDDNECYRYNLHLQNEYVADGDYTILNTNEHGNVRTVEKRDGTKGVCINYITNKWECFYNDDYEASKTLMKKVFEQHADSNALHPTRCIEYDDKTGYSCDIWNEDESSMYGCSMEKNSDGTAYEITCISPNMPTHSLCRDTMQYYHDAGKKEYIRAYCWI